MKAPNRLTKYVGLFTGLLIAAVALESASAADVKALVFSKTLMFRHSSIPDGIAAIQKLGAEHHFQVDATEDASWFTPTNLAKYQVVIFLSTSGDILNEEQQQAFKNYIDQGGGLAAIHAAVAGDVATEGSWPWYGEALCAHFTNHSAVVEATVEIEDHQNPS
ncbi:MAG TPA: ThuA domain-containing protein, partial [Bacillota bacterium]|nr:ThuA domain-containing protein [Bacillota bacterium]